MASTQDTCFHGNGVTSGEEGFSKSVLLIFIMNKCLVGTQKNTHELLVIFGEYILKPIKDN